MLGNKLFGTYTPIKSPVHSCPLWSKALFLLTLSLLLMFTRSWQIGLAAFFLVLALGTVAKIPLSSWPASLKPMMPLLLILSIYYLWAQQIAAGSAVLLTMLTLVAASRILLSTTPIPHIIDGFVRLCGPLKSLGISPERIGLMIALMIRSIPVIMNEYTLIQEAHRARGLTPWPHKMLIPLVIATVAYAQETGDALAARGLDQS